MTDPRDGTTASARVDHLETAAELREDVVEDHEVSREQISLTRRLRNPRTIISIVLPIIILVLIYRALPNFQLDQLVDLILGANLWLLAAAFLVYYLGFPLRGYRWLVLLRGTGFSLRLRDSTEIIYISWLVNCLVPAKLGDRATNTAATSDKPSATGRRMPGNISTT